MQIHTLKQTQPLLKGAMKSKVTYVSILQTIQKSTQKALKDLYFQALKSRIEEINQDLGKRNHFYRKPIIQEIIVRIKNVITLN